MKIQKNIIKKEEDNINVLFENEIINKNKNFDYSKSKKIKGNDEIESFNEKKIINNNNIEKYNKRKKEIKYKDNKKLNNIINSNNKKQTKEDLCRCKMIQKMKMKFKIIK